MISAGQTVPAATPAPAGGTGGATDAMGASCIMQAGMAVAGIVSSYYSMKANSIMLDGQLRSAQSQYEHQDRMAKINQELQIDLLDKQSKKIEFTVDHNKEVLESAETRQEAANEVKVVQQQIKEKKAYEKSLKDYNNKVDKAFGRGSYFYG